jgi:hypothetical protein
MQQPLADTRSDYMHHSSTSSGVYARPRPAYAFPERGALSTQLKAIIVNPLALILAWKPGLAVCLGKIVTQLWPNFWRV